MKLATGVDLIEIARIEEVIARHGKRYLERIYTSAELAQCGKRTESLAGRFAAKEATAKALGCGIGEDRKSTRLNSSHTVISYAVFCLRSEEHTSELQSHSDIVCRLLLEKK